MERSWISPNVSYRTEPVISFDGANCLLVFEGGPGISGARVDRGGVLLDPEGGFEICSEGYAQDRPAVAFNEDTHLVVWRDMRFGEDYTSLFASRVTTKGEVLDPDGIALMIATWGLDRPAIAADGDGYLLVWQDARDPEGSGSDIYGARLTGDGLMLDEEGFPICEATGDQFFADVVFDSESYLVVWQDTSGDSSEIRGARVSSAGSILDPEGFLIAGEPAYEERPFLATDGRRHTLVTYSRVGEGPECWSERARGRFVYTGEPLEIGDACEVGYECLSDFCVDGVCCNEECGAGDAGDCQACSLDAGAGRDGECVFLTAGWTCREAVKDCDAAEACSGSSIACPDDAFRPDGTDCQDGLFCNGEDSCLGGECSWHEGDPCGSDETCNEEIDTCESDGGGSGDDDGFCGCSPD